MGPRHHILALGDDAGRDVLGVRSVPRPAEVLIHLDDLRELRKQAAKERPRNPRMLGSRISKVYRGLENIPRPGRTTLSCERAARRSSGAKRYHLNCQEFGARHSPNRTTPREAAEE